MPVPQLPLQCSVCQKWVDRSRCAVMPVGADPMCSVCGAISEVESAQRTSQLTAAEEDEVLDALARVYEILWRSQGRSPRTN